LATLTPVRDLMLMMRLKVMAGAAACPACKVVLAALITSGFLNVRVILTV
jgi:hypothetical protein